MGLLMYRSSSPSSAQAPKHDSTAVARSPIRRTPWRQTSPRLQRRASTESPSLSPSSPRDLSADYREPFSVSGSYRREIPDPPQEPEVEPFAWILEPRPATPANAHVHGPLGLPGSTNRSTANPAGTTRRMQVTRQRATRRANLEAEMSMGRFVVRPILSEDEGATSSPRGDQPRSPTVDPMDLLVVPSNGLRRRNRSGNESANARSRSPHRVSVAPRVPAPDHTDGLGDRHRSPSVEDSDWETLRATIQPDEQLPSATSSFTSTTASTSSIEQSASAQSNSTARTSTSINHRYVLPTPECLDITDAQIACGVVCDDARDARPPFAPSQSPSRRTTREPSDQPGRSRSPGGASTPAWIRLPAPLRSNGTPAPERSADESDDANSIAPTHLRSPSPVGDPAAASESTSPIRARVRSVINLSEALRISRTVIPAPPPAEAAIPTEGHIEVDPDPFYSSVPTQQGNEPGDANGGDAAEAPNSAPSGDPTASVSAEARATASQSAESASAVGARLAEVQLQWQQLRRINELLQCGREVPGWLWEVAGLAPELGAGGFEI